MTDTERFIFRSKVEAIVREDEERFDKLVIAAKLDVSQDLVFGDWSHADFGDADIRGYNFTGCDLRGVNYKGARISGVVLKAASFENEAIRKALDYRDYLNTNGSEVECEAFDSISAMSDKLLRDKAFVLFDEYYRLSSLLRSSSAEKQEQASRHLFRYSAEVDELQIEPLSLLINKLFIENAWFRFCDHNQTIGRGHVKVDPATYIDFIAKMPAANRINNILKLFSLYEPSPKRSGLYPVGLLLVGAITHRDGETDAVSIACGPNEISVLPDHQSSACFNERYSGGQEVLLTTRLSNMGNMRNQEFIDSIFNVLFPCKTDVERPLRFIFGASNSWLVICANSAKATRLLAGGGIYLKQLEKICGLRRITVLRVFQDLEARVREFCRAAWRELSITSVGAYYHLYLNLEQDNRVFDLRKYRTFRSMWKKVIPEIDFIFFYRSTSEDVWLELFDDDISSNVN